MADACADAVCVQMVEAFAIATSIDAGGLASAGALADRSAREATRALVRHDRSGGHRDLTSVQRGVTVMPVRGSISHLDLNVSDPERSLPFYGLVLGYLGLQNTLVSEDRGIWEEVRPGRGSWGIEVRAPREPTAARRHERFAPGIDHLAFHAESRADVDGLYAVLIQAGYDVVDPPAEYNYTPGYYAVAFDDPDGIRLEVVHEPMANP
jgi:catechol 2,3-dioxygenase-like lactoylglutathione lyase family enzyme